MKRSMCIMVMGVVLVACGPSEEELQYIDPEQRRTPAAQPQPNQFEGAAQRKRENAPPMRAPVLFSSVYVDAQRSASHVQEPTSTTYGSPL